VFPVRDADALGDAGEVRRSVEASAVAGGGEDACERRGGAALAVGPGDQDGGELRLRIAQGAGQDAHVLEVEFAARGGWSELQTERVQMFDRGNKRHAAILVWNRGTGLNASARCGITPMGDGSNAKVCPSIRGGMASVAGLGR